MGFVDVLLGSEADTEGAAGGDQGCSRMTEPNARDQTNGHGDYKDEIRTKGLGFPVEDVTVGKERCGGEWSGCGHFLFDVIGYRGADLNQVERRRGMRRWLSLGLVFLMTGLSGAQEKGRLSDKDLQRVMQNLKDDAQPFRGSFANALKNSSIRKTTREKDARALVDTFAKQADQTLEIFKHGKKADAAVKEQVYTAAQIDPLVYSLQLNSQTTGQWEKLRGELHQIAQAYGVNEPYLAPQGPGVTSNKGTCLNAVGIERSRQLVNECLQVSPSTHPPCNAQNACSMIVDEIRRGCGLTPQGAPGFCAEYR